MEDIGVVKNISGLQIEVEIDPGNACGNCVNKSVCHLDEDRAKRTLYAGSEIEVKPGDTVQIKIEAGNVMFSAFLIFIFPLICLGIGYIIGAGYSQSWGIFASFLGLGSGFLLVRFVDLRIGGRKSFQPRITKILDDNPGVE